MTDITKEEVVEVLSTDESMSISEITSQFISKDYCPECGHLKNGVERDRVREEVRNNLRKLLDESRLVSTPDWEYRLPRRK